VGGALQVALSFLLELKSFCEDQCFVLLSSQIKEQLQCEDFPNNFVFHMIDKSPAQLKHRRKVVSQLTRLENKINPDVVFSVFGPTYWTPKAPHIMGFAIPQLVYWDSIVVKQTTPFIYKLRLLYYKYWSKKCAQFYIVETDDVKKNILKPLNVTESVVFVVGNTCGSHFDNYKNQKIITDHSTFKLVTISANYVHKNLNMIKHVLPYLKKKELQVTFHLTLPEEEFQKHFSGLDEIINLGTVPVEECPNIYASMNALFLPTLSECFSASYPEAMKMGKPILTSDLSFAHCICGDAALYFDPLDPKSIAEIIEKLVLNKKLQEKLKQKGFERLREFTSAQERAKEYIRIIHSVSRNINF